MSWRVHLDSGRHLLHRRHGFAGYSGDGGSVLSAAVNVNTGITLDGSGNVLFADGHDLIRVVAVSGSNPGYPLAGSGCGGPCTWTQGNIYTVAGTGTSGYNGDGISATSAGWTPRAAWRSTRRATS